VISRLIFYPLAIAMAIAVASLSLDAAQLNRVASAQLNIEGSTTLAWKSVLESLSFSFYSGASDIKADISALYAEAGRREQLASRIAIGFAAAALVFLVVTGLLHKRATGEVNMLVGDQLAIAVICLGVGLLAPILSLKAHATAPVLGQVVLKYEVKSVLTSISSLIESHNYIVAILLGTFSVLTPLLKLGVAIAVIQEKLPAWHERGVAFIKAVGKWSMADVFVVAVFVAYFAAGGDEFSEARIGLGLYFFAAYCLLSQYATQHLVSAFDGR